MLPLDMYPLCENKTKMKVLISSKKLGHIFCLRFSCVILRKLIGHAMDFRIGLLYMEPPLISDLTSLEAFKNGMSHGYNTMDLLGAFFFCTVAFQSIRLETRGTDTEGPHPHQQRNHKLTILTLKSCILGAIITAAVYIGFMFVAHGHANALQGLREEQIINAVSYAVLGKFGGLFVCIAVSFACIATALALTTVSTDYLHREIFKKSISKHGYEWYCGCLTIVPVN